MSRANGRTLLFFLVALAAGFLAWLVTESVLEGRHVPAEDDAAVREQAARNMSSMQESLAESIAGETTSASQERMDAPRGQALLRLCTEWTEFHDNHPTEATAARRDEACGKFRAWVQDGVVP